MKYLYLIVLSIFISVTSFSADKNDGWKFYPSYYSTNSVEESADKVYAVAQGALFSYGKEDNSIKQYTKGMGLSDMDISNIRYNKQTKSLLIVYSNQNIDIMEDQSTTNLPYLYANTSLQNKHINSITLHNDYAYLSAAFGVMVVNMNKDKKEITDTYNLGVNTTSCTITNGYIYATTTKGLLKAALTDNLLDKGKWQEYNLPTSLFKGEDISKVDLYKDKLLYMVKNKGVFYESNGAMIPLLSSSTIDTMSVEEDKLICISTSQFHIFSDLTKYEQVNNVSIKDISSYKADKYWIAEGNKGLRGIEKSNAGGYATSTEAITLDGPRLNSSYKIICKNNKVYMIPGGRVIGVGRMENPGIVMTYDYNKWSFIDDALVANKFNIHSRKFPRDYTSIAINPNDPEDIYVSSFGDGIIRFNKNEPVNWYNNSNSPLQTALNLTNDYLNIDGLTFDKEGNLWITNSEVSHTIKILDKDGGWHSLSIPELTTQYTVVNSVFITSTNKKWINVPRVTPRIVVLDDSKSLDEVKYEDFTSFIDQDKETFTPSAYTCTAEDKNGYVWLGTSKGPVYFTNPDKAISNRDQLRCTRVKLTADKVYYFLDNVRINTITVDQGNRKWFGTNGSGVYVLDNDNQEVVHQFNTTNSPLISDVIYSIAINDETGEVFIGTDKGLVSYRGEAIAGKEDYSDIYAYPNPVRPDFDDKVTITGLMEDSNIKITDINGNILYQTKSLGGQATWNCRNKSGNRVSTGIYLVLASTPNGAESVVTKIAVVK